MIKFIMLLLIASSAHATKDCPTDMVLWQDPGSGIPDCACPNGTKMVTDFSKNLYRFGKCQETYRLSDYNTPLNIDAPNLVLWLDADDPYANGYRPQVGASLSAWYDKSNYHNNFASSPTSSIYQQSSNYYSILFNGTSNCYSLTPSSNLISPGNSNYSIFIVFNAFTGGTNGTQYIISFGDTNYYTATNESIGFSGSNNINQNWGGISSNSANLVTSSQASSLSTTYVFGSIYNNSSGNNLLLNNNNVASNNNINSFNFAGSNSLHSLQTIGCANPQGLGNTSFFNGYIMEILLYKTALSSTQITQVNQYLNNKWQVY